MPGTKECPASYVLALSFACSKLVTQLVLVKNGEQPAMRKRAAAACCTLLIQGSSAYGQKEW